MRAKLPTYMLPQHYVEVDSIPLLPNGKIDRKALPVPSEAHTGRPRTLIGPRTDTEVAVAEIWKRLLGIEHVSVNDNFFDLGGHSLLAAQAVHEIEKRLGVRVGVRHMVMETLAQIASGAAPLVPDTSSEPVRRGGWLRRLTGR